ncbi:MAG: alpha-ketoglutarate-dependent dioxygenase AlkB [Thermodesulfobacteriota bacterium]
MRHQTEFPLSETALDYKNFHPVITSTEINKIISNIPGLEYKLDYITETKEQEFLKWIDRQKWITDLKRRVQHYGWKYDYKARKVHKDMQLGDLPEPLASFAKKLHEDGLIAELPDQVIVNEYEPGQGIAPHVDCEPCFGDTILTMSLGSGCVMEFTKAEKNDDKLGRKKPVEPKEKIPVWLEPRSVVSMKGDSRWWWFHGIPTRSSDDWNETNYPRTRRVSLTFRKVIV